MSGDQDSIEALKLDFERRKFDLEQEVEAKKIEIDRNKAKWTAYSIMASVLAACLTIIGSAVLQYQSAKTQFELKAAELILQTNDPSVTAIKAQEFGFLFHDKMPEKWDRARETFQAERYYTESDDLKSEIAKLLIEHPDRRSEIACVYGRLFQEGPTRDFLSRIFSPQELAAGAGSDGNCKPIEKESKTAKKAK